MSEQEPRFLLLSYKPSSTDYCMGCRMASYSSGHHVKNMLTAEELVKEWSEYLYQNLNLDCNEDGYGFWVFKDGIMVFRESHTCWDGAERFGYNSEEYYDHFDELENQERADSREINDLFEKAKALAKEKQTAKKEKEQLEQAKKQAEKESKEKAERLKQFEKLQREFGT